GAPQAEPAGEDLRRLRAGLRVAEEVGAGLGAGALLLRRLSGRAAPGGASAAARRSGDGAGV
ncbi:MAG: hypothetical protein AVDCRST_MAG04-2250, partial [uncultured Acetobacteraceae bacterium]